MNASVQEWSERYGTALREYLASPKEDGLTQAYDLGRQALALDVSIGQLVDVHAAAATYRPDGALDRFAPERSWEFLRETLAPFEMGFRGYQEANALLKQLNETLEQRVEERSSALREADRLKDEFLATLAHELRNPLAPVRNSLAIMKSVGDDAVLVDEQREIVERQIAQMVRLVDDLLDISRITRDKLELRLESVDLAAVVRHAEETCRPQCEEADQRLEVSLPNEPIRLSGDPVRLTQVVGNLLVNSCKYTEPGGRIWLTAERVEGGVEVTVRDTGIGIPPDMLSRVFDPFVQVDRSLERSAGGLGIGLSLVKRLVELHGGTVSARSEGAGRGSEFVVRLPLNDAEPGPRFFPRRLETRAATPSRRILVVDDNRDGARTLATLLKRAGNETQVAHDGVEAIAQAATYRPDVVLLDIGLPKMNGYDACRAIREAPGGEGIVIVALTGWGQEEDRRKSAAAGFDGHLVKPVGYEQLVEYLDSLGAVGRKN